MEWHGTKKEPNIEVHKGLKEMSWYIQVTQQQQGTKRRNHYKDKGEKIALGPHIHILIWWIDSHAQYHWVYCLIDLIIWLLLMFQGQKLWSGI